jgi:hypothetical protein
MGKNWIYDSIMGSDEPTPARPIPAVPIVDDRRVLAVSKQSAATDRLIRQLETESALKAVYPEVWDMMKNPSPSPVEPSTTTYNSPTHFALPQPTPDMRRPVCSCSCQHCRTQMHQNCDADKPCPQSGVGLLVDILDVSEEVKEEFRNAVRDRQRKARVTKHHPHLAALVNKFKSSTRAYGVNDALFARVVDRMTAYMADYVF